MGIGYALASGLVKGFTENIGREIERRQGEKDRIAAIQNAIITAGLGDDFNNKNVAVIQGMVDNASRRMNEQGGIDIFGTRGNDAFTSEEMMSVMGQLESTADLDDEDDIKPKSRIESGDTSYLFDRDIRSGTTLSDHIANINELTMAIQRNEETFRSAPKEVHDEFEGLIRSNAAGLMAILRHQATEFDAEITDTKMLGIVQATEYFDNMYKSIYPNTKRQATIADAFIDGANPVPDANGTDRAVSSVAANDDVNSNSLVGLILMEPVGEAEIGAATALETNFGSTKGNMAATWNAYAGILQYSKEEREELYDATIDFGAEFNIYQPMDATFIANIKDQDRANQMISYLREVTDNNLVDMAFILGAYQKPMQAKTNMRPLAGGVRGSAGQKAKPIVTARLHAARVLLGLEAKEEDFQKLVDADFALDTVLSDQTGLVALYNMANEDFTTAPIVSRYAGGFASAKNILGFFFDSDGDSEKVVRASVISSVAPDTVIVSATRAGDLGFDMATGVNSATGEKYITYETLESLEASVERRRQDGRRVAESDRLMKKDGTRMTADEMGEMYARFESLRISLAFQMARAADPSGRLSNQDVLQQLARLGQDIDTPEMMKARIKLAIDDFTRQKQRYGHMMKYKDATGEVTRDERLQIQGHHALTVLARKAGYASATAMSVAAQQAEEAKPVYSQADGKPSVMYGGQKYRLTKRGDEVIVYDSDLNQVTDESLLGTILSAPNVPSMFLPPEPEDMSFNPTANAQAPMMQV